ncbi:fused MFS/spermidine synthase [Candidatus Saccharibacteria bacterium]|nr:fused MFS/spermidine synthase [Candidatus Saccharibacteria bacterium]
MTKLFGWLKKYRLNFAAFVNGAVVLVTELVAVRLLSPYFGSSFFVWTSIIGAILLSLSIGYWQGGKLADKTPTSKLLVMILLTASSLLLVSVVVQRAVLGWSVGLLGGEVRVQSLVAALLLFAPANVFLGMVSPFIARLELHRVSLTGETVGNIFAAGTVGSIVGVFLTGYVLFGLVGSTRLLIAMALLCILNTFLVDTKSLLLCRTILLVTALVLLLRPPSFKQAGFEILADVDTAYSRYIVSNINYKNSKARILQTDLRSAQSGIDPAKPGELIFDYAKAFDIYKLWLQPKRAALIGGGASIYASHFAAQNPNSQIDVVEIDPALQQIATQYFDFAPRPNIDLVSQDGRVFLRAAADKSYNVIFVDAYNNTSIPFQLVTRQMVEQMSRVLADDGIVVANVISQNNPTKQQFLNAVAQTYQSVFVSLKVYRAPELAYTEGKANYILVAQKQTTAPSPTEDAFIKQLLNRKLSLRGGGMVLTDELAPVEQLQID